MALTIHENITRALQAAENLYHRLVLLVGETGSCKTSVLQEIAKQSGTSVVNVNLALSVELLELTAKQRSLRLPGILEKVIRGEGRWSDLGTSIEGRGASKESYSLAPHPSSLAPVVLDNTEILFDKDLQQAPLRLLQSISRNRAVVASWNGIMNSGSLMYTETGHPEYRGYDSVDALIVEMRGEGLGARGEK
ncbi:hypothetical protein Thiowin_03320 [Thiorhodovibrio winogradskyi]|uniref:ATPase dynein-related AAA domain-containing protein n=1 Tax=Thiorhodovibrio winogradskyi TaxID=77007 RepID=A0ABZ0SDR2_9GAMM|nr:BREX-3 system P-loop-containing protein BrxF [Thiorhodovibrio winogradskyi]